MQDSGTDSLSTLSTTKRLHRLPKQCIRNSFGGLPIPVRSRQCFQFVYHLWMGKPIINCLFYTFRVLSSQYSEPSFNALHTLRVLTHNHNRSPKCRCFLLNSP